MSLDFTALHYQDNPLILANVWDASSAIVAQRAGYSALGTSSAALSAMLGYEDGEGMSFDELMSVVARIKAVSALPLSVDMENGFGVSAHDVVEHLQALARLGVAGVNLEDSRVNNGIRQLEDPIRFADKISAIREGLARSQTPLFLNIRTDGFLLNADHALAETLSRARHYQAAGADGIFVPCVTQENEIAELCRALTVPLNVMCMPDLPDFVRLTALGVRRISMGNFVHAALQAYLFTLMSGIQMQQSFKGVFAHESH